MLASGLLYFIDTAVRNLFQHESLFATRVAAKSRVAAKWRSAWREKLEPVRT